ncbi:unnamed protein product [Staurois parvus]|uniref:Uncharacterized protein n=1 Tax=Staurois parvus TaxID=386267 RepID=A0ABN9BPP5_9NEOB|nr:unnamed protein product [Staurois parvus]
MVSPPLTMSFNRKCCYWQDLQVRNFATDSPKMTCLRKLYTRLDTKHNEK